MDCPNYGDVGVISSATAFVESSTSLYIMRFLLGAAEAGFFPGVILYLTYWLPANYRARMVAIFMVAIPVPTLSVHHYLGFYYP